MLRAMHPTMLGPFAIAPDGALNPRPSAAPAAIRFAWRGWRCDTTLTEGHLLLGVFAGRVPATAERGADRAGAIAALRGLRGLPAGVRLCVAPDHSIRFEAARRLAGPPTAVALVAAIVGFGLALDPYLDALAACASGNAKT